MPRSKDGIYRRDGKLFAFRYKHKGTWREKRTGTGDRDEAKKIKEEFLANLRNGTLPTEKARWSVEQAATQWCEYHAAHLNSDKSKSNEQSYLRQLIARLGPRMLKTINA